MMAVARILLVLAAALLASAAHAQFGVPWRKTPQIVIVAAEGDPRVALVDEAIAWWNRTLEESGAALRLPAATRRADVPIPERALQDLSAAIGMRGPIVVPPALHDLPGDIAIVLAHTQFISFASPFFGDDKRVIGIRGASFPPVTLPNVARNVIAHEIGHAIGLGHNADPALLMCGRPAPCRPAIYVSHTPRFFSLSEHERDALRRMYPPP